MIINIGNNRRLSLIWRHKANGSKKYSKCIIKLGVGKDSTLLVETKSHLHKGDIWNRNKGRKVAMEKALKALSEQPINGVQLTKQDRTQIWQNYADMRHGSFV